MRRIILLSLVNVALTIGCSGDDNRAANVKFEPSGGQTGKGGKSGRAGSAGLAGQAGHGGADGVAGATGGLTGGSRTVGGAVGAAGAAGAFTAGAAGIINKASAPIVTFESPPSVLDPNAAGVITSDSVTVVCRAVASPEPGSTVESASATIRMSQFGMPISSGQASSLMVNGAREVEFALNDQTGVESGILSFDCSAEDDSFPALKGYAPTLELLVDRGPNVTISKPSQLQNVALEAGVDVEFTIEPEKIADGDELYPVDKVAVTINGKTVTIAEAGTGTGRYAGHVALTDPILFPPGDTPEGPTTLQVLAVNGRATSVQKTLTFFVDSVEPSIAAQSPLSNSIIGKTTTVKFTVKDAGAGVEESTVGVRINAGSIFFYTANDAARWTHIKGSSDYQFTFSDVDFATSEAQATVAIFASDKVHNSASPGVTLAYFVDTQPPYVSLDPPTVREYYYSTSADTAVCSTAFDPLGEAINDLTIDNGVDVFRALVWDMANQPRDKNLLSYYSSVDPSNVTLYMQENPDQPLLIDSDGDGYCDNVDIGSGETRKAALKLDPVGQKGIPPYVRGTETDPEDSADDTRFGSAAPVNGICNRAGFNLLTPWDYLCGNNSSDMVRVIHHSVDATTPVPAIFAVAPQVSPTALGCTGTYWEYFHDMKRSVKDGWVCFVAVAYDGVGNRGVSAPLRLCYDEPSTAGKPSCATTVKTQTVGWHDLWKSYIPNGHLDTPFRAQSAETPPTCAKNCVVRPTAFDRYIINQKH